MTLDHELKALNAMNSLRLWMTWATPGHKLNDVNAMTNPGLWMIEMTRDPVS